MVQYLSKIPVPQGGVKPETFLGLVPAGKDNKLSGSYVGGGGDVACMVNDLEWGNKGYISLSHGSVFSKRPLNWFSL